MTDLEMTKLCAEAMGLSTLVAIPTVESTHMRYKPPQYAYCPLHDDAQAMALLKRFDIVVEREKDDTFGVTLFYPHPGHKPRTVVARNVKDLNRALVMCVAGMVTAKGDILPPEKP